MTMENNLKRFNEIVRGKIKKEIKRFISNGVIVTKKGNESIRIPVPHIAIPKFMFAQEDQESGGGGQGPSQPGKGSSPDQQDPNAPKAAGSQAGEHTLEVDISLQELADILGSELKLPHIKNKNKKNIEEKEQRYSSITRSGPDSLHHFKRTYKEALKRTIITGEYDPRDPSITPITNDKRYRTFKYVTKPSTNAVIIYMMDVSGSMGDEQKEIVRLTSFWLDTWLSNEYKGLERRYIIHDATAKEVNQDTFYRTKESGGTLISSAYKLSQKIIEQDYHPDDWNIYLFHFSDGDNWSGNDTNECLTIMETDLLLKANLFCYGQVDSRYGSGQFLRDLLKHFGDDCEKVITSQIKEKNSIPDSLKKFLGKGK
jgi:uncharacterized protein